MKNIGVKASINTIRKTDLAKSYWPKTKISGMVELGMLMKFHYTTGFYILAIMPEQGSKLAKIPKWVVHMALPFGPGTSCRPGTFGVRYRTVRQF